MSDREKKDWQTALLTIWAIPLAVHQLAAWGSGGSAGFEFIQATSGIAAAGTIVFLLILSWRLAYVAGRKR